MTETHVLYKTEICPFCMMVRRFMDKQGMKLPLKDTMTDAEARAELVAGGGRATVPCLRIEQPDGSYEWMYESRDIMAYLAEQQG